MDVLFPEVTLKLLMDLEGVLYEEVSLLSKLNLWYVVAGRASYQQLWLKSQCYIVHQVRQHGGVKGPIRKARGPPPRFGARYAGRPGSWSNWRCTYRRMADSSKKLRLTRAKKGLVEGLTKLVHEAAGELVTDALIGLEESPRGSAASRPSISGGRAGSFRVCSSSVSNVYRTI